jgi:uncharacterized membrane protein
MGSGCGVSGTTGGNVAVCVSRMGARKIRQGILWEASVLVRLSLIVVGVPEALSRRSAAATMFEIRVVAVILTTLAAALTVVVALTIWNVLEGVRSGPLCNWSVVLK